MACSPYHQLDITKAVEFLEDNGVIVSYVLEHIPAFTNLWRNASSGNVRPSNIRIHKEEDAQQNSRRPCCKTCCIETRHHSANKNARKRNDKQPRAVINAIGDNYLWKKGSHLVFATLDSNRGGWPSGEIEDLLSCAAEVAVWAWNEIDLGITLEHRRGENCRFTHTILYGGDTLPQFPRVAGTSDFPDVDQPCITIFGTAFKGPEIQNLLELMIHEIGHSLGFYHERDSLGFRLGVRDQLSIMGYAPNRQVTESDLNSFPKVYEILPGTVINEFGVTVFFKTPQFYHFARLLDDEVTIDDFPFDSIKILKHRQVEVDEILQHIPAYGKKFRACFGREIILQCSNSLSVTSFDKTSNIHLRHACEKDALTQLSNHYLWNQGCTLYYTLESNMPWPKTLLINEQKGEKTRNLLRNVLDVAIWAWNQVDLGIVLKRGPSNSRAHFQVEYGGTGEGNVPFPRYSSPNDSDKNNSCFLPGKITFYECDFKTPFQVSNLLGTMAHAIGLTLGLSYGLAMNRQSNYNGGLQCSSSHLGDEQAIMGFSMRRKFTPMDLMWFPYIYRLRHDTIIDERTRARIKFVEPEEEIDSSLSNMGDHIDTSLSLNMDEIQILSYVDDDDDDEIGETYFHNVEEPYVLKPAAQKSETDRKETTENVNDQYQIKRHTTIISNMQGEHCIKNEDSFVEDEGCVVKGSQTSYERGDLKIIAAMIDPTGGKNEAKCDHQEKGIVIFNFKSRKIDLTGWTLSCSNLVAEKDQYSSDNVTNSTITLHHGFIESFQSMVIYPSTHLGGKEFNLPMEQGCLRLYAPKDGANDEDKKTIHQVFWKNSQSTQVLNFLIAADLHSVKER